MGFFESYALYPVYEVDWYTMEYTFKKTYYRWFIDCGWVSDALRFPIPESVIHYRVRMVFERIKNMFCHKEEDDLEEDGLE